MTVKILLPPVEVPIALDTPLWNMRITLDGREYLLEFDYLEREFRWRLSVYTIDGIPLVVGVKMIADWPLLRQYADSRLPPGELVSVDTSPEKGEPPDFAALGRRVKLFYYPISP